MQVENHKEEVPFEHYREKFAALNPEEAAERLGVSPETVVTPELWVKFLNAEALHTRVLVNQAEKPQAQADARALAAGLRAPVCMAALQKGWIECLC